MTIADIQAILKAELVCGGERLDTLTGLVNPQVVRTADMMDMVCVIFVRGKDPTPEMIELANDREIVLMKTPLRMFTACGLLYSSGLHGGDQV